MSERLPPYVICIECRKGFPVGGAIRRRVHLWARPKRGGTLSNVAGIETEDIFICDPCLQHKLAESKTPTQPAGLL